MKRKAIILQIMTLTAVIFISTACQPQIKRMREVENDSSALLPGLIQETDFSREWRWIRESTFQHAETPTPQNRQMLESAMGILTGDFGVERYYFTIAHGLERYQQNPPRPQVAEFQSEMGLTNTATMPLNLISLGESMSAKCWKAAGTTVCDIVTSYPHFLSTIVVYAPAEINDIALMEILNQVLNAADSRIKEMGR